MDLEFVIGYWIGSPHTADKSIFPMTDKPLVSGNGIYKKKKIIVYQRLFINIYGHMKRNKKKHKQF